MTLGIIATAAAAAAAAAATTTIIASGCGSGGVIPATTSTTRAGLHFPPMPSRLSFVPPRRQRQPLHSSSPPSAAGDTTPRDPNPFVAELWSPSTTALCFSPTAFVSTRRRFTSAAAKNDNHKEDDVSTDDSCSRAREEEEGSSKSEQRCTHHPSNDEGDAFAKSSWHHHQYLPSSEMTTASSWSDECDAVVVGAVEEERWFHPLAAVAAGSGQEHAKDAAASSVVECLRSGTTTVGTADVDEDDDDAMSSRPASASPPASSSSDLLLNDAIEGIRATHRWSSSFVRKLRLCPWAGKSLDTHGAMRYAAVLCCQQEEKEWQTNVENMVREAGVHLASITGSTGAGSSTTSEATASLAMIDPSVAIAFVVLVPSTTGTKDFLPGGAGEFDKFYEFFINLEDKLLDEADVYYDTIDTMEEDEDHDGDGNGGNDGEDDGDTTPASSLLPQPPLGAQVTIAGFHPRWQFGSDGGGGGDDALDYEKRSPYPTISIVMTSAIDALMGDDEDDNDNDDDDGDDSSAPVTESVAAYNQRVLRAKGSKALRRMFDEQVVFGA